MALKILSKDNPIDNTDYRVKISYFFKISATDLP